MKETGIIMSGSHPVDILEGRKTMTRRTQGLEEIFFLKCGTIITDGALLDRVLRRCVEALKGGKIP